MEKKGIHMTARDFIYNPNRDLYEGSYIISINSANLQGRVKNFTCIDTLPAGVIYQRHDVLLKNERDEVSDNALPDCSLSVINEANCQKLSFVFNFDEGAEDAYLKENDKIIIAVYVVITEYESFEERNAERLLNRVELPESKSVELAGSAVILSGRTLRSDVSKRLRTHLNPYWSTRASSSPSMDIEYLTAVGTGKYDMRSVKIYDVIPYRGDTKGSARSLILSSIDMSEAELLGYNFNIYYSRTENPTLADYVPAESFYEDLSWVRAYMIDFGEQVIRKNIRLHFIVAMKAKDKNRYLKWDKVISSAYYESEIFNDEAGYFKFAGKRETNAARLSITHPECLIGNMVFYDKNRNGIRDNDEKGVPFQKVALYRKYGKGDVKIRGESYSLSDTQQTSLGGHYVFRVKQRGIYVVKVELESGYTGFSDIPAGDCRQSRDMNSFDKKGYSSEIHVNFSEHGYQDIQNFCVDAGIY